MFAAKRRKVHPIPCAPIFTPGLLRVGHSKNPLQQKQNKYVAGGQAAQEQTDTPPRLEGKVSKIKFESEEDAQFHAFTDFIEGRRLGDILSARKFQKFYDTCAAQDEVIVWLCMTAMAVLNPGDMQSRLLYQHLSALMKAVALKEMHPRTAFYFYENAIKSPAFRQFSERQLENGARTRLLGICAAADAMREANLCRRPMQPYFELYQRISERSEFFTPWGFPPLYQFDDRLQLMQRLRPFSRVHRMRSEIARRKIKDMHGTWRKYFSHRIFWIPPLYIFTRTWQGPFYTFFKGVIPD